jgi:CheY-like chemotaxis protein
LLKNLPAERIGARLLRPRVGQKPFMSSSIPVSLLLVEDSSDDAFFFKRTLNKTGLECTFQHVADGELAIKALNVAFNGNGTGQKPPNLVFLDLKMPVMNGFEVLAWIKRQPFSQELSVIVLSGSDDSADRLRASELGARGYLVKPINPVSIAEKIHLFNSKRDQERKNLP